ncbi:MAG: Unknown protein [uncultured Campylobacterales bacterium]|uniref:OmpA-like domain-containing protein n=1 Tax=uncultured Campylobacterales bacterium TaxID=352960 RepID=A0A6S6SMJ1_9BACT|nr:MAG: Unknown protein [uncultured Campylobacterales bacterium]
MKLQKIIISSVLAAGLLSAANSSYEAGISIGINSLDQKNSGDLDFEHGSFQLSLESKKHSFFNDTIAPRIDFEYTNVDDRLVPNSENAYRLSINGIYDFWGTENFQPYLIGGVGYEVIDEETEEFGFTNQGYVQGGAGFKYYLLDNLAVKFEGKAFTTFGEGEEYHLYAGLVMPFGGMDTPNDQEKIVELVESVEETTVSNELEELNSIEDTVVTPPVIKEVEPIRSNDTDTDTDGDGIIDSEDTCVNTLPEYINKIDENGCVAEIGLKVLFTKNRYSIANHYEDNIASFAKYLKDFPKHYAQIKGHASTDLTTNVGITLSENRASSVKKALINLGIEETRLRTIGMGGFEPVASNKAEKTRKLNRRVEVRVFVP